MLSSPLPLISRLKREERTLAVRKFHKYPLIFIESQGRIL